MASARTALYYLSASRYTSLVIQIVSTMIIARLLTPSEIGVFSVGAALVALGHLLRDFGSGSYIVQEKELTTDRIRAAFTVTLILGWTIAATLLIIAPAAAAFYEKPDIQGILSLLSINFFLLPFGSIPLAYAQRHLNFVPSAISNVGATLLSASVSVILAYQGFSYFSLALGSIAGSATTVLLVNLFRPKDLPHFLPGFRDLRRVISFGSKISSINILEKLSTLVPELVLGKSQGFHDVGLFSRTQGTALLFNRMVMMIINPLVAPLFAERSREGKDLRELYIYGMSCVTGLSWAFSFNLVVMAEPFVLTLYGGQWVDIVPLVQIASAAMIVQYLTTLVDHVLIGTGNVNRLLRFSVLLHTFHLVGFIVTGMISLYAVFIVIAISPVLRFFLLWGDVKRIVGLSFADLMGAIRLSLPPAVISAGVAGLMIMSLGMANIDNPILTLLLGSAASAGTWLLVARQMKHPLWDEGLRILAQLRKADQSKAGGT